ncbi:MAG: LPS export ABC transporter permease LptG [Desulfobacterota bacterium]|jgi:lipopolysaccharide export system permease protein|nr:LPS export ABC transporter permease LptG [Thermodesulfobacteriota bacterium]
MTILSKYVLKEFYRLFAFCEGLFVFLFLMVDFLQKIDNFMEAKATKAAVLLYFVYKAPFIVVNMVPAAVLISVIILFTSMKKKNELTALRTSGLSLFSLCKTMILGSLFIAVGMFLVSETVVPYTSSKGYRIWNVDVRKQDPGLFYGKEEIWYRGGNAIYWIRQFNPRDKTMGDPTFYFFDSAFRVTKRLEGRKGVWKGDHWRIENGILQELKEDGQYGFTKFETYALRIPESPETFMRGTRKPEEMSYWQLKEYAETVRREGYNSAKYLVDMNIKLAFPFISLILLTIGIPLSLAVKKGGTPLAVSIGMAVCFLYVLVLGFSRSLGLAGVLPPLFAAWVANFLFLFLGIYMMLHMER